jgi:hypothetical protein
VVMTTDPTAARLAAASSEQQVRVQTPMNTDTENCAPMRMIGVREGGLEPPREASAVCAVFIRPMYTISIRASLGSANNGFGQRRRPLPGHGQGRAGCCWLIG